MPLTPEADIRQKVLRVLRNFISLNENELTNQGSIRGKLTGLDVPRTMIDFFLKLGKPPVPIINIPITRQRVTDTIQSIINFVHEKEEVTLAAAATDDTALELAESSEANSGPSNSDVDLPGGEQEELADEHSQALAAAVPPTANGLTAAMAVNDSAGLFSTLVTRFQGHSWDVNELVGLWKLRYESLMISSVDDCPGLVVSWIGADGHGIVSFATALEPPTNLSNGWVLWAKGKSLGEMVGGQRKVIAYELAYHQGNDAIRIRPEDSNNWDPKTHCSIVIEKKSADSDEVAGKALMTNDAAEPNETTTITLTKRKRGS